MGKDLIRMIRAFLILSLAILFVASFIALIVSVTIGLYAFAISLVF